MSKTISQNKLCHIKKGAITQSNLLIPTWPVFYNALPFCKLWLKVIHLFKTADEDDNSDIDDNDNDTGWRHDPHVSAMFCRQHKKVFHASYKEHVHLLDQIWHQSVKFLIDSHW